ncbi:MAG: type VI secretion system ATPase TssH [Myxococcales bacterium]|jgi:type VI secretion system protein VasG
MRVEPKSLVRRLTATGTRLLEAAAGKAVGSQHYEIDVEHVLLCMLEQEDGEAAMLLEHHGQSRAEAVSQVERALTRLRSGNPGRPVIADSVLQWMEDAWLTASVELGEVKLRSGALLLQLLLRPGRYSSELPPALEALDAGEVKREIGDVLGSSGEALEATPRWDEGGAGKGGQSAGGAPAGDGALARFATDFTAEAAAGRIDPIFGRHREIRQMVDILSRRRKNNPIIVGEPGVGKTALVEGLALAIDEGDVPEHLRDIRLLGLDMGALQAGASVKGEFENRLKAVISEVKSSPTPIILFIDEAHTLIGAGGPQGGSDAANLLKPALARGELRTVAATTWAEYKKYFEKDAALERRFQLVKVEEPSEEDAIVMLRGLSGIYEKSHGVAIRDEAIEAAVRLSHRYISGRQLPDKAVDLLDTTAARVRVERATKPEELVSLELSLQALERRRDALQRDLDDGDEGPREALEEVVAEIERAQGSAEELRARWETQKAALEALVEARQKLAAGRDGEGEQEHSIDELKASALQAMGELEKACGDSPLIHADADADAVARTVASWTGIPVGKMQSDTAAAVMGLETALGERIIGQDPAVSTVSEILRISHAGIRDPDTPIGVMLFVGPSGVGKTETALALADRLYGGERFMTTINMSEFQEKHTVSRLIGSPPGYVGYGEGGLLTEAVRQRPYSVVLLDECEKADLEVMNLFYQVFDKGMLTDGEGRLINFRNTLIILTSNLASDRVMECFETNPEASAEEVTAAIRPTLSAHFQPALLARMSIVPYAPIRPEAMESIARLKLGKVARRIEAAHGLATDFEPALVTEIARRCTESETGARNIDHILRGSLMPAIAEALLQRMTEQTEGSSLSIGLDDGGGWRLRFA